MAYYDNSLDNLKYNEKIVFRDNTGRQMFNLVKNEVLNKSCFCMSSNKSIEYICDDITFPRTFKVDTRDSNKRILVLRGYRGVPKLSPL